MDPNKIIRGFAQNQAKLAEMVPTYSGFLLSHLKVVPGLEMISLNSTASGAECRFKFQDRTYHVAITPEREGN